MSADRTRERLSLAVEHLQNAVAYSRRGRSRFFDPADPDTRRLVESELRKAFESLNREGASFFAENPTVDRERIGAIRQVLTHDYAEVAVAELWALVTDEAPRLLRRLVRARRPPR